VCVCVCVRVRVYLCVVVLTHTGRICVNVKVSIRGRKGIRARGELCLEGKEGGKGIEVSSCVKRFLQTQKTCARVVCRYQQETS
jgi:hypothetical protein